MKGPISLKVNGVENGHPLNPLIHIMCWGVLGYWFHESIVLNSWFYSSGFVEPQKHGFMEAQNLWFHVFMVLDSRNHRNMDS